MSSHALEPGVSIRRRDFLTLVAGAGAAIGGAAILWPLVDAMNPAADVLAAGAPMDIDLTHIAAGQQIVVRWRGSPILIVNRTPEAIKTLQSPDVVARLSIPIRRSTSSRPTPRTGTGR